MFAVTLSVSEGGFWGVEGVLARRAWRSAAE